MGLLLADDDVAMTRALKCAECPRLFTPTWTCKECGCFMKVKVKVKSASCPLGEWDADTA